MVLANHHRRLRRYAPLLFESFDFSAAPPSEPLLGAVEVLKQMNAAKRRKVPDDAPTGAHRLRHAEMGASRLLRGRMDRQGGIRGVRALGAQGRPQSGDVYVGGSNRFRDFEDYLVPRERWEAMLSSGDPPVAVDPDLDEYLAQRDELLHEELSKVSRLLPEGGLPVSAWRTANSRSRASRRTSPTASTGSAGASARFCPGYA